MVRRASSRDCCGSADQRADASVQMSSAPAAGGQRQAARSAPARSVTMTPSAAAHAARAPAQTQVSGWKPPCARPSAGTRKSETPATAVRLIGTKDASGGTVPALCQLPVNQQKDTFGRRGGRIDRKPSSPPSSELPMPRIRSLLVLFAVGALLAAPFAHGATSGVVISQIYAGGGNAGASYTNDFVELFNRGAAPVDLAGWTIQYASASSTSWQTTALAGSIGPGRYYPLHLASTASVQPPPPTP